jgi:DNA-binding CsgD family transcriptional regulator
MNETTRAEILERYEQHVQRFEQDAAAVRKRVGAVSDAPAELRPRDPMLSERELDVLGHLANGLTDQEIAAAVGISEFTVKTHLRRLYGKLAARNRAHAVARAVARGDLTL